VVDKIIPHRRVDSDKRGNTLVVWGLENKGGVEMSRIENHKAVLTVHFRFLRLLQALFRAGSAPLKGQNNGKKKGKKQQKIWFQHFQPPQRLIRVNPEILKLNFLTDQKPSHPPGSKRFPELKISRFSS